MIKSASVAFIIFVFACIANSQEQPMRVLKGQAIRSAEKPALELQFGKGFKYVGGQKFVLYDVANAEQHFFVDANAQGRIKRLYWVQFEGYLSTNTHSYDYDSPKTINLGGFDFFVDPMKFKVSGTESRPDSDGAHARAFLAAKGYTMVGSDVIAQRLVHLVDERKRDELMIIYLEDLSLLGLTAADLTKGGKAEAKWPEIAEALLARAQKDLRVIKKK